ncbi:MAG: hypothetical protein Q9177_001394, partial [Variospora cf. flavescens]
MVRAHAAGSHEHYRELGCELPLYLPQPINYTADQPIQWLSYSPVANTAAAYFSTTSSVINWLSTAFLFAFVVASPLTIYALHRGGPRLALIISSLLILVGNWIRYAGTRASPPSFPAVMVGQILIGLAQPFVLSAPTHYSSL